jgi:beta-phosphoglucomutase family hydrolase
VTADPSTIVIPPHIRGLIFDCDGTIADTMPLHYRAWVSALGEHGVEFPEALFYQLAGVPTDKIVQTLNERHGHNMPVKQTAEYKDSLFEQLIPQAIPIEPVVRLVRQYHGKLPMAVASGGTLQLVSKTLTALSLLDCFQAIVTADDVKHGKPAPDIFLEAARRIGIEPWLCCVLEDGEPGLQAARAAGMMEIDIRPMYRHMLEHRRTDGE